MDLYRHFFTTDASNNSTPPDGFPENMAYGAVNNAARAMMGGIARWQQACMGYFTGTGGGPTAYTFTTGMGLTAYASGMVFTLVAGVTSTGAITLNVDSIGARNVVDMAGNQLRKGSWQTGRRYSVVYDGTQFKCATGLDANGIVVIASGNANSGANIDITDIPQHFTYLQLALSSLSFTAGAISVRVQGSVDNGASFDTTAGNYTSVWNSGGVAVTAGGTPSFMDCGPNTLAADTSFLHLVFHAYQAAFNVHVVGRSATSGGGVRFHQGFWTGGANPMNALRITSSGGTFDGAGFYELRGYS